MAENACLFCRIARRELDGAIVYEDEHVVGFKDIGPKAPTHLLVVPKRHVASLSELTPEDAPLAAAALLAVSRIAADAGLTDYRVVVNNGAGAGQSVFHLHFHLLAGRAFAWPPG